MISENSAFHTAIFDALCKSEFPPGDPRRKQLIDYINSHERENPSDIVEYISDELLDPENEEVKEEK